MSALASQPLPLKILRLFAWGIPGYRELFARMGAVVAGLVTKRSNYYLEGQLRAMTFPQQGGVYPRFIGRDVVFAGRERINLGDRVILYGWSFLSASKDGFIRIGERTHIDVFSVLYGHGGLTIGNHCAIASGLTVYTQSNQYESLPGELIIDQPVKYAPVTIGDDVWIGARVTVLPGVTIHNRAVIGAGAVVRQDVDPGIIVAGVPAREIGRRSTDDGVDHSFGEG